MLFLGTRKYKSLESPIKNKDLKQTHAYVRLPCSRWYELLIIKAFCSCDDRQVYFLFSRLIQCFNEICWEYQSKYYFAQYLFKMTHLERQGPSLTGGGDILCCYCLRTQLFLSFRSHFCPKIKLSRRMISHAVTDLSNIFLFISTIT